MRQKGVPQQRVPAIQQQVQQPQVQQQAPQQQQQQQPPQQQQQQQMKTNVMPVHGKPGTGDPPGPGVLEAVKKSPRRSTSTTAIFWQGKSWQSWNGWPRWWGWGGLVG